MSWPKDATWVPVDVGATLTLCAVAVLETSLRHRYEK